MSKSTGFKLPDLLSYCPFEFTHHDHMLSVCPESVAWMQGYGVLKDPEAFSRSIYYDFATATCCPDVPIERVRLYCDTVVLAFGFDDLLDLAPDYKTLKPAQKAIMEALSEPHNFQSEITLAKPVAE